MKLAPLLLLLLAACAAPRPASPAPVRSPVVQVWAHGAGDGEFVRLQSGSGFVVDPRGLVVTGRHVVALPGHAPAVVTVVFDPDTDGERRLAADIVHFDAGGDLALLAVVPPAPLPTLPLGRAADLRVGRPVRVQGFPGRGRFRETHGVVLAHVPAGPLGIRKPRLECDAFVSGGSSGGPVLDADGRVLGVVVEHDAQREVARAVPVGYLRRRLWQWDVLATPDE